ncbi:MAG: hypothetical protein PHS34_08930 [Candidatus Omnitrophica bacterium]|nr:hypothetical protein [Candidatus Omnitrophota bacterium]
MKDIRLMARDVEIINGKISLISKEEKLNQQVRKCVLTVKGNYLHEQYGSLVSTMLGKPQITGTDASVIATIRDALDYFIRLQQAGIKLNIYDAEEVLYKVLSITLNKPDPRAVYPDVQIMNGAQNNIEFLFNVF